jgi:hypothetical protein
MDRSTTSTPPHQPSTEPAPAWAVIGIDHLGTITWWDAGASPTSATPTATSSIATSG